MSPQAGRRPFKEFIATRFHANRALALGEASTIEEIANIIGDEKVLSLTVNAVIARKGGVEVIRTVLPLLIPLFASKINRLGAKFRRPTR